MKHDTLALDSHKPFLIPKHPQGMVMAATNGKNYKLKPVDKIALIIGTTDLKRLNDKYCMSELSQRPWGDLF